MDRLIQMGKDLGFAGEKLQDFVKQQQDYERGERIAERELERDKLARRIRKGNLKGVESRRKKLRQIRKGNFKGIGSQRKKRKGRIGSRRRKKKERISSRRKKKIGKSSKLSSQCKKKKGKLS